MRKPFAALLALALSLCALPALAAVDAFIWFDSVKGESLDQKHKDWIEIMSFSFGATNAKDRQNASVHVTRRSDKTSLALNELTTSGRHIQSAIIDLGNNIPNQPDHKTYYKIVLTDVIVTSYRVLTNTGGSVPVEQFSLSYQKIEFSYREQKADGSLGEWTKREPSEMRRMAPGLFPREPPK